MTSKKLVAEFIAQKNLAIVGVSRNPKKFGNYIYRELKGKGYNVFPVNSGAEVIEGDSCYPNVKGLSGKVEGVIINVPPEETEKVLRDVNLAGIKKVWMQQGSQSKEAEKYCEENGIDFVSNECIIMFAQPTGFGHRAHRWIWGILGKLPK